MPVTLSRRIAFEILLRVEKTGAHAGDLLFARLGSSVKHADAALATEVTFGVLRSQRLLDYLLAPRVGKPMEALDLEVRIALRMGIYQLRYLDRVPAHAVVDESVELVRFAKKRSAAGLVNAVLRNAVSSARTPADEIVPAQLPLAERLGVIHSHPTWLVERWLEHFGQDRTQALLESNNRAPQLAGAILDEQHRAEIVSRLEKTGARVSPGHWLTAAVGLSSMTPSSYEPVRDGQVLIQDEASQLVSLLLNATEARSILDVCAAPGGKTALLARRARPGLRVIAGDLHPSRLRAMQMRLADAGVGNVSYVGLNAARPLPLAGRFDRILVDAPCSGTGTLSRNPEIRWRLEPRDLARLHQRQVNLLSCSLAALAPAGRLVYSTCSLEPEENEDVVREALQIKSGFRVVSGSATLAPHLLRDRASASLFDVDFFFRTFPPEHRTDGFFAAIIESESRSNKR